MHSWPVEPLGLGPIVEPQLSSRPLQSGSGHWASGSVLRAALEPGLSCQGPPFCPALPCCPHPALCLAAPFHTHFLALTGLVPLGHQHLLPSEGPDPLVLCGGPGRTTQQESDPTENAARFCQDGLCYCEDHHFKKFPGQEGQVTIPDPETALTD